MPSPLPELEVSPVEVPEPPPPAPAEAEGVAAPPVAADVGNVLEGTGCGWPVAAGGVEGTGACVVRASQSVSCQVL